MIQDNFLSNVTYEGAIFTVNQREINDIVYPAISSYNSMLRILLIVKDINEETAKILLKQGYKDFDILNNAILVLKPQKDFPVFFCVFNPFDHENHFYCPTVNFENMKEVLWESGRFAVDRRRNLHKYNLRVN
jgi:hypothetical protein